MGCTEASALLRLPRAEWRRNEPHKEGRDTETVTVSKAPGSVQSHSWLFSGFPHLLPEKLPVCALR